MSRMIGADGLRLKRWVRGAQMYLVWLGEIVRGKDKEVMEVKYEADVSF